MPAITYDWEVIEDHTTKTFYAEIFNDATAKVVAQTRKYLYAHTADRMAQKWVDTHQKEK